MKTGPQNSGRCRQVVAIRRWSLTQIRLYIKRKCQRTTLRNEGVMITIIRSAKTWNKQLTMTKWPKVQKKRKKKKTINLIVAREHNIWGTFYTHTVKKYLVLKWIKKLQKWIAAKFFFNKKACLWPNLLLKINQYFGPILET